MSFLHKALVLPIFGKLVVEFPVLVLGMRDYFALGGQKKSIAVVPDLDGSDFGLGKGGQAQGAGDHPDHFSVTLRRSRHDDDRGIDHPAEKRRRGKSFSGVPGGAEIIPVREVAADIGGIEAATTFPSMSYIVTLSKSG